MQDYRSYLALEPLVIQKGNDGVIFNTFSLGVQLRVYRRIGQGCAAKSSAIAFIGI
jgi:hypothetical protein